ncbi:MAG: sigma-54-dependent Fis family transcriptional regulator [Candidatus Marinimicrobia bacterium]|nr:sigma-54-dependent Fis family transcriptional regulator [Candidatus Neomarinimicrobiota bacterium]
MAKERHNVYYIIDNISVESWFNRPRLFYNGFIIDYERYKILHDNGISLAQSLKKSKENGRTDKLLIDDDYSESFINNFDHQKKNQLIKIYIEKEYHRCRDRLEILGDDIKNSSFSNHNTLDLIQYNETILKILEGICFTRNPYLLRGSYEPYSDNIYKSQSEISDDKQQKFRLAEKVEAKVVSNKANLKRDVRRTTFSAKEKEKFSEYKNVHEIVANSVEMLKVFNLIELFSNAKSVLITGESGTGKELVAKALHRLSKRSEFELITKSCGCFTHELIMTELFGYKKGAFTGAVIDKVGLVTKANNSTLFLDEIGELPIQSQPPFLRVVEYGEFSLVGDEDVHKVNFHLITATNKDLKEEIEKKNFRLELYHRIIEGHIHIPPIRNRKEDIPLICEYHFEKNLRETNPIAFDHIKNNLKVTMKIFDQLSDCYWDGNVRQIINHINRAIHIIDRLGNKLTKQMLRRIIKDPAKYIEDMVSDEENETLIKTEDWEVIKVYISMGFSKSETAKKCQMSRPTLNKKIYSICLKLWSEYHSDFEKMIEYLVIENILHKEHIAEFRENYNNHLLKMKAPDFRNYYKSDIVLLKELHNSEKNQSM